MGDVVKRSAFAEFLNTTPASTATWSRMGEGITTGAWQSQKNVTTEQYIHEDTARTTIEGEQESQQVSQKAYAGDPVFDFIDNMRISHALGADCETEMLRVYIYKGDDSTPVKYVAEKQTVVIEITSFGGDGGSANAIEYTIHGNGDFVAGTCTITDGVPTFTANS